MNGEYLIMLSIVKRLGTAYLAASDAKGLGIDKAEGGLAVAGFDGNALGGDVASRHAATGEALRYRRSLQALAESAPAPSPAKTESKDDAYSAPPPQPAMVRMGNILEANKPFSFIDSSCNKWSLPPATYQVGTKWYDCFSKTYTPLDENVIVDKASCFGAGGTRSHFIGPWSERDIPSNACSC